MISKNVMKTHEFEDSIFYRASCSCGADEHDIMIEFEVKKDMPGYIFLNFYKKVAWCSNWKTGNWFVKLYKRITCALRILFTGYIEVEETFILEDDVNIDGFIEALVEGKLYMKQKIKEQNNDSD